MSCSENTKVLTGIEPYRDPFQILFAYETDTQKYSEACKNVYEELDNDYNISSLEKFDVMEYISNGEPEESFRKLRQVLDE